MPQQMRDVLRPRAQRRHGQRQHVQPVEQVFAELAGFRALQQIAIGRRDDAHVDLHRLAAADRLDLALLQRAQQLHLRRQRQLADLVEKQRAAAGFDELADVALGRAGERALLVTEQDRLDQIVRDRAAVDRDERLCGALARAVDRARDQLLADAGFAFDQHGNRRGGGLLGSAQHRRHRRAARDDIGKCQPAFAAVADALQFALQRARVQGVAQRHLQPLEADRLDDEVVRAGAHRRDDIVDAAMGGLHDDRKRDAGFAKLCQHAHAVEAGHDEVQHHGIDARLAVADEVRDGRVAGVDGHGLIARPLHHVLDQPPLHRIVVRNQYRGDHLRHFPVNVPNRGTLKGAH